MYRHSSDLSISLIRWGAHWKAATVSLNSLITHGLTWSPHSLYRVPPLVEVPPDPICNGASPIYYPREVSFTPGTDPPARCPIQVLLHALIFTSFSQFFIHENVLLYDTYGITDSLQNICPMIICSVLFLCGFDGYRPEHEVYVALRPDLVCDCEKPIARQMLYQTFILSLSFFNCFHVDLDEFPSEPVFLNSILIFPDEKNCSPSFFILLVHSHVCMVMSVHLIWWEFNRICAIVPGGKQRKRA